MTDITQPPVALGAFPLLENIDLEDDYVFDISPLAGLIKLKTLRMGNDQVSDITPLAGLTALESLRLAANPLSDISALNGLVNLSILDMQICQIQDISALEHLPNLKTVELDLNRITDLAPLVNNADFGDGAILYILDNPLNCEAINVQIPALKTRGVEVHSNGYCPP